MCRLFGFRSVISSQVHRSLVEADNAILHQSNFHSDGWGVAYYVANAPHLVKSTSAAVDCTLFRKVSGVVASETVVAHLRRATQGELCITNSHPFQYGRWVFAHNGNIENFHEKRERILEEIPPILRRYILGNTDSEALFYLLLSRITRRVELHRSGCDLNELAEAVRDAVSAIVDIVGPYHLDTDGPPEKTYLSFLLTNGSTMIAHQGGKSLYYSTYKTSCSDSETCPYYGSECVKTTQSGYVNHLLFSSEPIQGENVWFKMKPGQMAGVDFNMRLKMYEVGEEGSILTLQDQVN